jgi:beclin 1
MIENNIQSQSETTGEADGVTDEVNDLDIIDEEILKVQRQIQDKQQEIEQRRLQLTTFSIKQHEMTQLKDLLTQRVNSAQQQYKELLDEFHSLEEEEKRVQQSLQKYMQINPINDAFHIWYAGPYGTISNFRLGTLPIKPIDSNEINAALGQAALVINIIAEAACVEFKHYQIFPMGSFPKVAKVEDKKTLYPLFIDQSSFSFFPKRNFNVALTGFMCCVHELGEFVAAYDPTMAIPYKINVGETKIGDVSFVYGVDDEVWTRSLKFMLSNIKWIVAWYTKHGQTVLAN